MEPVNDKTKVVAKVILWQETTQKKLQDLIAARNRLKLNYVKEFDHRINVLASVKGDVETWLEGGVMDCVSEFEKVCTTVCTEMKAQPMVDVVKGAEPGAEVDHTAITAIRKHAKAAKLHNSVNDLEIVEDTVGEWKSMPGLLAKLEAKINSSDGLLKAKEVVVILCASQMLLKRSDKPKKEVLQKAIDCTRGKKCSIPPSLQFEIDAALAAA